MFCDSYAIATIRARKEETGLEIRESQQELQSSLPESRTNPSSLGVMRTLSEVSGSSKVYLIKWPVSVTKMLTNLTWHWHFPHPLNRLRPWRLSVTPLDDVLLRRGVSMCFGQLLLSCHIRSSGTDWQHRITGLRAPHLIILFQRRLATRRSWKSERPTVLQMIHFSNWKMFKAYFSLQQLQCSFCCCCFFFFFWLLLSNMFILLCKCFQEDQAVCLTGILYVRHLNVPWMKVDISLEACVLDSNVTVINSCSNKCPRNKTWTVVFQLISWNNFWNFIFWMLPTRAHLLRAHHKEHRP